MTQQLPIWVQYLAALSTPIIALMVAAIAFLQWRTAHQRVVLDLFERRMTIITGLLRIVAEIRQESEVRSQDSDLFDQATKGAEFLFRPEVTKYLAQIYDVLVDLHLYEVQLRSAEPSKFEDLNKKRQALRNELRDFFPTFRKLVAPYVQMHQKLLWI